MKIKELHIQNYKSLVDLKIAEPNPFTVFAGSNGAGKSNIFEALEFFQFNADKDVIRAYKFFGNIDELLSRFYSVNEINFVNKNNYDIFINEPPLIPITFSISYGEYKSQLNLFVDIKKNEPIWGTGHFLPRPDGRKEIIGDPTENEILAINHPIYKKFFLNFSRIFLKNSSILRQLQLDDSSLNADCSNLEKVLKRVLKDENKREEICEWLDLLIPGFENIEIASEPLSGTDSLIIYEKGTKKPYTKNLLSDGTYNILALLTAVYQSDEPQFLCIEEPENGLNPKVQKELVNLFRQKCEEEGHYIWLNTHSQTIVNQLTAKELILVDKMNGETKIKQLQSFDTSGLPMDEAWLTNTLGGGIPW